MEFGLFAAFVRLLAMILVLVPSLPVNVMAYAFSGDLMLRRLTLNAIVTFITNNLSFRFYRATP